MFVTSCFILISCFVQTVCGTGNTKWQTATLVADKGLNFIVECHGLTGPVETDASGRARMTHNPTGTIAQLPNRTSYMITIHKLLEIKRTVEPLYYHHPTRSPTGYTTDLRKMDPPTAEPPPEALVFTLLITWLVLIGNIMLNIWRHMLLASVFC